MQLKDLKLKIDRMNDEKPIVVVQFANGRRFKILGFVEYLDEIQAVISPLDNPHTKRPKKGKPKPGV